MNNLKDVLTQLEGFKKTAPELQEYVFEKEKLKGRGRIHAWRKDTLFYVKKKECKKFRTVNELDDLTCVYSYGEMNRRAYWLTEDPQYVLVQYLEPKKRDA